MRDGFALQYGRASREVTISGMNVYHREKAPSTTKAVLFISSVSGIKNTRTAHPYINHHERQVQVKVKRRRRFDKHLNPLRIRGYLFFF